MKASVHKFIAVQQGSTAGEVAAAIRAIVKREGKVALKWPIMVVSQQSEDGSPGIVTGLPASFPDNKGEDITERRVWIGFNREQ